MEEFKWLKTGLHGQALSRIWSFKSLPIQPKTRQNSLNFRPDFIPKGLLDDGEVKFGGFRAG